MPLEPLPNVPRCSHFSLEETAANSFKRKTTVQANSTFTNYMANINTV